MSKEYPAHEMVLDAMIRDYKESKATNPSDPKITWTRDEMIALVARHFGEEWNAVKASNQIQTLKYRNEMESVGQLPRHGKVPGQMLWCPIRVMEMETEPDEKPEPTPEPVEKATPEIDPETVARSASIQASEFKPVVYESAPIPVETYPIIRPIGNPAEGIHQEMVDEFMESVDRMEIQPEPPVESQAATHDESWGVAIPVQQKRKRKHGEIAPETPMDELVRTVRELSRTVGDIQKQVSGVTRSVNENRSAWERSDNALRAIGLQFDAFDESLGNSIKGFLDAFKDSHEFEVAAFRFGFIAGFNECRGVKETFKANPILGELKEIGQDDVEVDFAPDAEGEERFHAHPPTSMPVETKLAKLTEGMVERGETHVFVDNETRTKNANEVLTTLRTEVEKSVADGNWQRHYRGNVRGIPVWAQGIWGDVKKEFAKRTNGEQRKLGVALARAASIVEVWEVTRATGRITVTLPATDELDANTFSFAYLGTDGTDRIIVPSGAWAANAALQNQFKNGSSIIDMTFLFKA